MPNLIREVTALKYDVWMNSFKYNFAESATELQ